jgi:hypothetical protein
MLGYGTLAATFAAALVTACSSFSAADAPATAANDGAAAAEGSAPDAGVGSDAGDATVTCQPLVTQPFDSGTFPDFMPTQGNTGNVKGDSTHAAGAPPAPPELLATTPLAVDGNGQAAIGRTINGFVATAGTSLVLDYDVYLEPNPNAYQELGCTLIMSDATQYSRAILTLSPDSSLQFEANGNVFGGAPSGTLADSTTAGWQHVRAEATVVDPTHVAAVMVTSSATQPVTLTIPTVENFTIVELRCGIDYAADRNSTATTVSTWVDNVSLQRCTP